MRKRRLILDALHAVIAFIATMVIFFIVIPKSFIYIGYVMFTGDFGRDVVALDLRNPLLILSILISLSWLVKFYWRQRDTN